MNDKIIDDKNLPKAIVDMVEALKLAREKALEKAKRYNHGIIVYEHGKVIEVKK